jgi:hypothetical protein
MAQDKTTNKAEKGSEKPSANLPLFYKNPVPLDAEKHKPLGLKKDFSLKFTSEVNAVPINMIEMPQICHFYPIAFSPDENASPVALLGLRDNENLYVNDNGEWQKNAYIPSYIRRYPFIFSEMPDTDQLTLCVDMHDDLVGKETEQMFFDESGGPSQLSQNALDFCKSYHAAAQQTIEFSKALAQSGLLVDRQAEVTVPDNKKISFSGFRVIDEEKLAELDDKVFLDWRKKGWLPFVYAHLFSGAQWQRVINLLNEKMKTEKS